MKEARLKVAKRDIVKFFSLSTNRVFTGNDISKIIDENRSFWRLTASTGRDYFIEFMLSNTDLTRVDLGFPYGNVVRYTWGDINPIILANSIKANAYFSHYSAMFIHQLTNQIPKSIYLNLEQPTKPRNTAILEQSRVDMAFKRKPRITKNIAKYRNNIIYLLNGKNTGNLGVETIDTDFVKNAKVTNIERTLIDITVRPIYSGGVSEVLGAYRNAYGRVSVNQMVAMLKKLDYIYPYHQAIGFYLQKAGSYKRSTIDLLHDFDFYIDFYLSHAMSSMEYDKKWRLYYPKGF